MEASKKMNDNIKDQSQDFKESQSEATSSDKFIQNQMPNGLAHVSNNYNNKNENNCKIISTVKGEHFMNKKINKQHFVAPYSMYVIFL